MNYKLAPTDSDILHYAKGSESKKHNYISRVFQKGRWVYTYAKNRARGNKVTNKNGKKQYAPNIKTGGKNGSGIFIERDPNNPYRTVIREHNVLNESLDPDLAAVGMYTFNHYLESSKSKPMVTNRTPYPYDDKGNWVDKQYAPNDAKRKTKKTVTNNSYNTPFNGVYSQYTPNYKTNVNKQYSPTIKTETWDSHKWKNGDITEFKEAREYNAKLGKATPLRNAHRSYENINRHSDDYDEALKRHESRKKK